MCGSGRLYSRSPTGTTPGWFIDTVTSMHWPVTETILDGVSRAALLKKPVLFQAALPGTPLPRH